MEYIKMFEKGKIGSLTLKNRVVMPAIGTSLATSTGEASDEIIAYYEERAKGGCGLIITEITRIDNITGVGTPNQLAVTDGFQVPRLERLARAVQKHGSKIFVQLHHPGRQTSSGLLGGTQSVAPSAIACNTIGEVPRALETEEIDAMVKQFVKGAKIAQMAGIDGVELHAAHGYLLGQFLSPHTNRRTDKYGGSLMNRMRFLTDIVLGIKHICGKDFPISVRIDGDEFVDGGIKLDEAVKTAIYLESIGVDAINVSSGTYESAPTIIEPISYPQGWKKHLSLAIMEKVSIPVIACNNIKSPQVAEKLLQAGVSDFVALGRSQLADPEFVLKAKEGREAEIRPCISCLECIGQLMAGTAVRCAVNPRVGYENEFKEFKKDGENKVVAIIGGGPAGMEAARVLATRDFKVVLFENRDQLGGSVQLGSVPTGKEKLYALVENMEYQINKLGVDIRLNTSPTLEDIKALNPHAVFVAMGGDDIVPPMPGIDGDNVLLASEILEKEMKFEGKKFVVAGSGMTGLETAHYLVSLGNKVDVIEMIDEIGKGSQASALYDVTSKLAKAGVGMETRRKLVGVSKDEVYLQNTFNNEKIVKEADYLVLALGISPKRDQLITDLENEFENVIVIGDSQKAGNVREAVKAGFDRAYTLA